MIQDCRTIWKQTQGPAKPHEFHMCKNICGHMWNAYFAYGKHVVLEQFPCKKHGKFMWLFYNRKNINLHY